MKRARDITLDGLLDVLAELVADKVAAKVVAARAVVYTTATSGPHIPGKSRAWSLRNVKHMKGARKVGRDWLIDADAYEAWLSERDEAQLVAPAANDVDRLVESGLKASGFRRTK